MDIRCPQCDTLYEFDESRLQSGSATLKCRKCQHMFRLGEDAQPSREDQRRWMVRDPRSGDVLYFSGFDQLHEWIVERKVDRRWEISRTGDKWKPLGDIGEFRPIFQVVDNVSDLEGQEAVPEEVGESDEGGAKREKRDTLTQFDNKSGGSSGQAPTKPGGDSAVDTEGEVRAEDTRVDDEPTEPSGGPAVEQSSTSGERRRRESSDLGRTREPSPRGRDISTGPQSTVDDTSVAGEQSADASSSGVRDAQADASSSREVQLDTDQFGGASSDDEAEDDAWSFDDEPDLDEEIEYGAEGGPSGGVIAGVVGVLVLAVGGYLFAFERQRLADWTGMTLGNRTVEMGDSGRSDAGADKEERPRSVAEAVGALDAAVREARRRAGEREEELVSKAAGEGASVVYDARGSARDAASEEAEESEETSDEPSSSSVAGLLKSANDAVQNGRAGEGRRLYQKILEREPSNSEALTGIGWTYLSDGRAEIAARKFKRALEINPSYGDAYIGLGHAYRNLGNKEKALEAYQTYLDKLPGGSKASIAEYQAKQLKNDLGR